MFLANPLKVVYRVQSGTETKPIRRSKLTGLMGTLQISRRFGLNEGIEDITQLIQGQSRFKKN